MPDAQAPKPIVLPRIAPPPGTECLSRGARFAERGERRTRYHLPTELRSGSPVGYRTRVRLTPDEGALAVSLLSLPRPTAFAAVAAAGERIAERELFEECSLGILSARQSTNFRGHRQVTLGPKDSHRVAQLLRTLRHEEAPPLDCALYTHIVVARPYRTPFTQLLTFIGHERWKSPLTVAERVFGKVAANRPDIPTIGYLTELHLGILAEAMERAAIVASGGTRRAQVFLQPLRQRDVQSQAERRALEELEALAQLTPWERRRGARIGLVVQVGNAIPTERVEAPKETWRRLGANTLALRSERIQPGVNADETAPPPYQTRQHMEIPEELTTMAGRAAYNAFCHFLGCSRETAKSLILLERVDVLTPGGKERLRAIRKHLEEVTDRIAENIPRWADLPTGRALTRNVARGKKAFGLAGQRIYIGGLSKREVRAAGLDWTHAVRAFGAAAARSAALAEIAGCIEIPAGCDMLAGICLMAGPVNQNDIGKTFYGSDDLLAGAFPDRAPVSLLVWTLRAKTVADPIGNEEQLLNAERKGVLVDLRPAPHEVIAVRTSRGVAPLRFRGGKTNGERAFGDVGNFVTDPSGVDIPGNRGAPWPEAWAREPVWGPADEP